MNYIYLELKKLVYLYLMNFLSIYLSRAEEAGILVSNELSIYLSTYLCIYFMYLELKKLVYLYLMNYAKSQPDMAIMAVNTFVKGHT